MILFLLVLQRDQHVFWLMVFLRISLMSRTIRSKSTCGQNRLNGHIFFQWNLNMDSWAVFLALISSLRFSKITWDGSISLFSCSLMGCNILKKGHILVKNEKKSKTLFVFCKLESKFYMQKLAKGYLWTKRNSKF